VADEDLELAHRLADVADGISGGCFDGGAVDVETKVDGTPVTRADREVEVHIGLPHADGPCPCRYTP
jgi:hypothetical protein